MGAFLIRLPLILFLIIIVYAITEIFDTRYRSVSDFEQVRISNYMTYMKGTWGLTRRYWRTKWKIVIEADRKKYDLHPYTPLIPDGSDLDKLYDDVFRTNEAVLWIDKDDRVMGLLADGRLIIPPIQGVKFHENERKYAMVLIVIFVVLGIFYYRYVKAGLYLDWKLSPRS
jgi:hypothetical protein